MKINFNPNEVTNNTVGAFIDDGNQHNVSMLTTLKESFNGQNMNYMTDIADIFSSNALFEQYKDIVFGDYCNFTTGDNFAQKLQTANAEKVLQLAENSANIFLKESASASGMTPVTGLTMPLLQTYWSANTYKDFLPSEVSDKPIVNRQLELLFLKDASGKKHYAPDCFDNELSMDKLLGDMAQKVYAQELPLPLYQEDMITKSGGSIAQGDELSRNFHIAKVIFTDGDETIEKKVRIKPEVMTGVSKEIIKVTKKDGTEVSDMIFLNVDFSSGIVNVGTMTGKATKVVFGGSLSTENNMRSISTGWETDFRQFVIPVGDHINTELTEESVRDLNVVYNVDSQAKALDTMTRTLSTITDLRQKKYLDESAEAIQGNKKIFIKTEFDCKPLGHHSYDEIEWAERGLKDTLNKLARRLRKVLKTPNCFFAVMGHPNDVSILDGSVNWAYTTTGETPGGNKQDYSFGLINGENRFVILSSDRAEEGKLKVILRPTTPEIISYINFYYTFLISDKYRNPNMPNVPNIMASCRYLVDEVLPVQGEIVIKNNTISVSEMY